MPQRQFWKRRLTRGLSVSNVPVSQPFPTDVTGMLRASRTMIGASAVTRT